MSRVMGCFRMALGWVLSTHPVQKLHHKEAPPNTPVVSGPKHQIFLASSLSQPNSSDRILERTWGQDGVGCRGAGQPM